MRDVFIAGAGMVPIGVYPDGSGRGLAREAAIAALQDAGCTFDQVDAFIAGSVLPTSPRAAFVAKQLGLTGVPVVQVINASASGSSAIHSAVLAIESGRHDLVLVVGYDAPDRSAENSIAAQGYQPPVTLFAQWAMRRMRDAGTRAEHLAMITAKNWNYARENPYAVRRADHVVTIDEVLASKMLAPPLTTMMCTPWCHGAAAVVVASEKGLKRAGTRGSIAKLRAAEFQSERYGDFHVFEGAIVGPSEMSASTAAAAYKASGLGPADVDVVQVHEAFAIEELVYMELLGFTKEGETERLVEQGAFGPDSRERFGLPEFSTDGGLIARGHPGGPTGVCQVVETLRRFREHGDRIGLCHMLGAGSVCTVQIFEKVSA